MDTITRKGASSVAVAFGFAAVASAAIVAAAPTLLPDMADVTVFMTFWSAIFVCSGILTGLSLEVTRTASAVTSAADGSNGLNAQATLPAYPGLNAELGAVRRYPRVAVVGAIIGLSLGVLFALTSVWWGGRLFSLYYHSESLALIIAAGVVGFTFHHLVAGALAGAQQWKLYSALVFADSAIRVFLVGTILFLTHSVLWAAAATAFASFAWLAFVAFSTQTRAALGIRSDVPLKPLLLRLGAAALATGSSALLVIGFPTLLAATTSDTAFQAAAPLLLALTLTRAPLMIPLTAVQGVAITHFVKNRDRGLAAMWPIGRIAILVGLGAALAAGLLGPWLLELFWGLDYRVNGLVLAGLTLGATGLALLTLTGGVCQAVTRHGIFVAGWLTAVAVAVATLVLPLHLFERAVLALLIGPLAGIIVHLTALRSNRVASE